MMWALLFFAASVGAVTSVDVTTSILEHYPLISASELKAQAAEGEVTAAQGSFDHKIKFKGEFWRQSPYNNEYYETFIERQTSLGGAKILAGHRQGAGNFNYYDLKKQTSPAGQIFAGITLPVLRNFQTDEYRTSLKISKLEKEKADQELILKKLISVHKGLSLYYKWILQCKKLEITRHLLDLAKKRQDMIEKKFKSGDTERLKVTDNRRQINKRESEFIKAELEERMYATQLSLFLRDKNGNPQVPAPMTDAQSILERKYSSPKVSETLPQTKILSADLAINRAQYDLSDQSKLPGLSVDVLGGRELSQRPNYGEHILQVGINFDFPLENRKGEGKTVAYHYKRLAVEKELLYMRQELEQQAKFSELASENAISRFQTTNSEYENTASVAKGELRKWELGASDLFVVNLREQDQADVDIRRWSAMYDYHQAKLDLGLFTASLPVKIEEVR